MFLELIEIAGICCIYICFDLIVRVEIVIASHDIDSFLPGILLYFLDSPLMSWIFFVVGESVFDLGVGRFCAEAGFGDK